MRQGTRGVTLGVLAAIVGLCAWIGLTVIPTRGPFRWDEATHALKGLVMAHDLRQGDWLGIAYNSYRQVLYPPLHSWLLAVAFNLGGASAATVSWLSVALFGLGAWFTYLAGRALTPQSAALTGALAAGFWLTSPALGEYATQGMLEIPGLAVMMLGVWVLLRLLAAGESASPRRWAWLGAAIAATYLMRVPFGIILGLAVVVTLLPRWARLGWARARREAFWLALPLVVFGVVWFAYLPKLPSTVQWLINYPDGVDDPYSVEGWLFYPLALARISGAPWLFALWMLALAWALVGGVRGRSWAVGFLVALIAIQFGIGMLHQNKQARYLFPLLPAFYLLTGYALATGWTWLRGRGAGGRAVGGVALLLLLAQGGLLLRATATPGPGPRPDPVTAAVVDALTDAPPTLLVGSMEMTYPGAPLLDWRLAAEMGQLSPEQAGAAAQIEEGRRLAGMVARLPLPAGLADAIAATLTAYDRPAPLRTLYVGLPLRAGYSQGPQPYARFLAAQVEAGDIGQVILVERVGGRPQYPRDYLAAPLLAAGWTLTAETRFDEARMVVSAWRRP
jgi:4-amino-4-deoxy-L-arabinose transferase-like glycosyltransferase